MDFVAVWTSCSRDNGSSDYAAATIARWSAVASAGQLSGNSGRNPCSCTTTLPDCAAACERVSHPVLDQCDKCVTYWLVCVMMLAIKSEVAVGSLPAQTRCRCNVVSLQGHLST